MRTAAAFSTLALLASAPALAQQATPSDRIDWSKPVVGVDANILQADEKGAQRAVEVFTYEQLNNAGAPTVKEFVDSLKKPETPCDPAKTGVTVRCAAPVPKEAQPARTGPPGN